MKHKAPLGILCALLTLSSTANANDPYVYFAGNPANSWYTVGGTCAGLTLTANYLFFISGDINSAGLPARWTALPFRLHASTTFDSIAYMPALATGAPSIRVFITGATGTPPVPDLNNIIHTEDFGLYPGDPPIFGQKDEAVLTYYGGTTTFTYVRTNTLNTTLTLPAGLYFAIIVGDEDYSTGGPFDAYVALGMGAPGGPQLYYDPRGTGSSTVGDVIRPGAWQQFRYNPATFPGTRILNTDLPFRAGDPFGNPGDTSPQRWRTYHSPNLYHGVFGLRRSGVGSGKVTGNAITDGVAGASPPTNVEVIFYMPGTNHRVARFSMPTAAGPSFPIDTPMIAAGTYDVVVRPVYAPTIITANCPTDINVANITFDPNTHWLGVRIPGVAVSGIVDLGDVTLPTGDTNADMVIDDADLLNVLFGFGGSDAAADVNEDGVVDDIDLLHILFGFGLIGEDGDED